MLSSFLFYLSLFLLTDFGIGYYRLGKERFFPQALLKALENKHPEVFFQLESWRQKWSQLYPLFSPAERYHLMELVRQFAYWLTTNLHCEWLLKEAQLITYATPPQRGGIGEAAHVLFQPYTPDLNQFAYPLNPLRDRVRRFLCNRSYFFKEITCDALLQLGHQTHKPTYSRRSYKVLHFCLGQRLLAWEKLNLTVERLTDLSGVPFSFCELYPEERPHCPSKFTSADVLDALHKNHFDGEICVHVLINPYGFGGLSWRWGVVLPAIAHLLKKSNYQIKCYLVYITVQPVHAQYPRLVVLKEFASLHSLEGYLYRVWHYLYPPEPQPRETKPVRRGRKRQEEHP